MKGKMKVLLILALVVAMLAGMAVTANAAPSEDARALTRLFIRFDPDNLDAYLELKQEHREFHESRIGLHDQTQRRIAAEFAALIDSLIEGEMTLEEAQQAFEECRDMAEEFRDELEDIRDDKQAENEDIREQLEDTREQIREALEAEEVDEELMVSLLAQSMELFDDHLQADYKYAEQIDTLVDEYYPEEAAV